MKESKVTQPHTDGRQVARRGFLSGVGATGLATAMTLFGRTPAARASVQSDACCTLCGPRISYETCSNARRNYTWFCTTDLGRYDLRCYCCERGNTGGGCGGVTGSAVWCYGLIRGGPR